MIGILPLIIRAADDISAFHNIKIRDITHHSNKQCYKNICDSSELFVAGALFLFSALVLPVCFFSLSAGHLPFFALSF